jgi:hypothetical protein
MPRSLFVGSRNAWQSLQVLNLPEVGESLCAWVSDMPGWVVGEDVWPDVPVVETDDVVESTVVAGAADVVVAPPAVELVVEVPPLQP